MRRKFVATFGNFYIDSDQGLIYEGSVFVNLQPKELALLCLLVEKAGGLVTKEQILDVVWNGKPASDESIARCISAIKSRLREASSSSDVLIKAEYGRGYRFIGSVSSSDSYISEDNFYKLLIASPDVIVFKDGKGRRMMVNRAGLELFRFHGVQWQGKTDLELAEIFPPEYEEYFQNYIKSDEAAWQARKPTHSIETVKTPDGETRTFEVIKSPLFNMDGSRKSLVIQGRDVSQMTYYASKMRIYGQAFSNSSEAILITDADNHIILVNNAFTTITGYKLDEVIGKNPRVLSSGRHDKDFYRAMWHQIRTEGIWRGEIWDRRKNGEIYPKWLDISTVKDHDGAVTNYIAIFSDLSERKAIEEKLHFLAYHDPLTGLANRLLLRDRFDWAINSRIRNHTHGLVALLFLDLDQFKSINDSLGHVLGDQLLLSVAGRLQECVRSTDTICRQGGDEFVILLADVDDIGSISAVTQKILDRLTEPFDIHGYMLNTSFSIGISVYPDDAKDFDTLLKMADTAMYSAKDSGRNTYRYYTEQMNMHAMERMHMKNALHQALQNGEFVLYYQPQLDLETGKLVGAEALIRWNKPDSEIISPGKFIPVAEESGLIVPIGEWVLREACRQAKQWIDAGYEPITVAVNLSGIQFQNGDILNVLTDIVNETGLSPEWLELELTESILIRNAEQILDVVRKLNEKGFRLSIDDFGTGYSSLAYLKRFKVDKLKIDQSFIRNLGIDPDDAAIVKTIIQLARGLNLRAVAEGVETDQQVAMLRNFGCNEIQGYYYCYPLMAKEFEKKLKQRKEQSNLCDS